MGTHWRNGKNPGRIAAIDAMRGLAIILMAFSHGLTWFHTGESRDVIALFGTLSLGDAATAIFFLIAGISLGLSIKARRARGIPAENIWDLNSHRFRQLFLLGLPLTAGWGVLQAQAVSLMFITFWALRRERPVRGEPFLMALGLAGLHVLMKPAAGTVPVLSVFFTSDFPIFATTALVAAGFGWGLTIASENVIRHGVRAGAALAAAFAIVYYLGGDVVRGGMSPGYLFAGGAAALLGLASMHRIARHQGPIFRLLALLGQRALFLFLAHYAIIAALSFGFGWWNRFDAPTAAAASSVLVAVTVLVGQRYPITGPQIYGFLDSAAASVQEWGAHMGLRRRHAHPSAGQLTLAAAGGVTGLSAPPGVLGGPGRSGPAANSASPAPFPQDEPLPVNIRLLRPAFQRVTFL